MGIETSCGHSIPEVLIFSQPKYLFKTQSKISVRQAQTVTGSLIPLFRNDQEHFYGGRPPILPGRPKLPLAQCMKHETRVPKVGRKRDSE